MYKCPVSQYEEFHLYVIESILCNAFQKKHLCTVSLCECVYLIPRYIPGRILLFSVTSVDKYYIYIIHLHIIYLSSIPGISKEVGIGWYIMFPKPVQDTIVPGNLLLYVLFSLWSVPSPRLSVLRVPSSVLRFSLWSVLSPV